MEILFVLEVVVILVLGTTLIIEINNRYRAEEKITHLQELLNIRTEEVNYLRNANTKESTENSDKEGTEGDQTVDISKCKMEETKTV